MRHRIGGSCGDDDECDEDTPTATEQACEDSIKSLLKKFLSKGATKQGICFSMPGHPEPASVSYFQMAAFTDFMHDTDEQLGGATDFKITSELIRQEREEYEDWEEESEATADMEQTKAAMQEESAKKPPIEPEELLGIMVERQFLRKVGVLGTETKNKGRKDEVTVVKLRVKEEKYQGGPFKTDDILCYNPCLSLQHLEPKSAPSVIFGWIFFIVRTIFTICLVYIGAVFLTAELWDLDLNCLILGGTEEMCGWGDKGRNRIRCGGWDFECQVREIRRRLEETVPGEEL